MPRLNDLRRQIGRQDHVFVAQGAGALDRIFQLADVARIIVMAENIDRFRIDLLRFAAGRARLLLQKMIHEQRNVLQPLAQRRNLDRDDRQPVIKILAERAVLDLRLQRPRSSRRPRAH